jgi:Trk K+ transport system NAD-binding subunit
MKILILDAGRVGGTLPEHLATEAFDIALVDRMGPASIFDRMDIQTASLASHPDAVRADDADMLKRDEQR